MAPLPQVRAPIGPNELPLDYYYNLIKVLGVNGHDGLCKAMSWQGLARVDA